MLRLSRAFCAVLLSVIYFSGILMASTAKADEGTDAYNAMQVAAKNCDRAAYNKNLATLENLRDGTKDSVKKLVYQTMLDNLPAYNCPPKSAALPFPGWIPTLPGALGVISRDPAPYAFSFSTGPDWMHYSSHYQSTGTQPAAGFGSSHTAQALCGGVNGYWPVSGLPYDGTYGGGVNVCGLVNGKSTLYSYVIHPGGGAVTSTVDPGVRIETYIGTHWNVPGPGLNPYLFMRAGPVFAQDKISISSNQTGAGGKVETADHSGWTTGVGVEVGYSSMICQNCAFGNPLRWSVSGKGYWFNSSLSVSAKSSTFNFTETASIRDRNEYSLLFGLGMPLRF
jgi:hypothetical protein